MFGVDRLTVAAYEDSASMIGQGAIDLFWPGKLIVEHKSTGKSLDEAFLQASDYIGKIKQKKYKPRYVVTCDFVNFRLFDLAEGKKYEFTLDELPDKIELFNFMVDKPVVETDMDPVNQKAAKIMGHIHDGLRRINYPVQDAEKMLTRLAFCMFADDAGIFEHGTLRRWFTKHDVVSTGGAISTMFDILNTPEDERQTTLPNELKAFTYINGDLFAERIATANLDMELRNHILETNNYDWSKINPAVFGGMFQSVMDKDERRKFGAHYTTEENILKVIRPLFLDKLWERFAELESRPSRTKLEKFQEYLASLNLFDPACGSGNFLSIAYKEMRRLELRVIEMLHPKEVKRLDVSILSKVNVHQFYGIELKSFSASIAEISLWMTDHLMNRELGAKYGITYDRIPLERSPNIVCADALELDWNDVIPVAQCCMILGNPPYGGSKVMSKEQRQQVRRIANLGGSGGTLDYVAAWFLKAAQYTEDNHTIHIGFVATNSITQGEQVGQLWPILLDNHTLRIQFAYRSFKWGSEAPGVAHVHVVIIGLGRDNTQCRLFDTGDYTLEENPCVISPYMVGARNAHVVLETSSPLNGLPRMVMGSQPIDDGHYIFTDTERKAFLQTEPGAEQYMRPYVGARDYIHRKSRWILALHEIEPSQLRALPQTIKRVDAVKRFRLKSKSAPTVKLADTPTLYNRSVLPDKSFLIVPRVSSERRRYVPIGYVEPPTIPSDATLIIQNATLELFGLLTSRMHMVWLDRIGGRLKSDYRYSAGLVYNTFPVPGKSLDALEPYAQSILDVRKNHSDSTLADLYDPVTMPPDLAKAHRRLDRKVDWLYRRKLFNSDDERIEFLLERYEGMTHDS